MQSDSRVLYSQSTVSPGSGHLLYVRAGTLLAQPFDPVSWANGRAGSRRERGLRVRTKAPRISQFPTAARSHTRDLSADLD